MIKLKQIRLINWYGFNDITVPIGFFTLIAGKNGNGKSVLLDAIKYALYGDTVFNKSTENKGSRTISSYTRGLLDATAGTYMRPADKNPNVYTHIVLEMEDAELKRSFILGTAIDTDSGNGCRTQRYVIENKTLKDMSHTYEKGGLTYSYSAPELQKLYGLKMLDVTDGLSKFMQRSGLRFNGHQLATFRRKLRSIMSYDPNAKIDTFIRESVLEEKTVDFSKLIEAKNNIDKLNRNFSVIDAELNELEEIIELFEKLERVKNIIFADDVKIAYRKFLTNKAKAEEASRNMNIAMKQASKYEEKLKAVELRENELRNAYLSAKDSRDSMNCAKAIIDAEDFLQKANLERDRLQSEKDNLCKFQMKISELMAWFVKEQCKISKQSILASLISNNVDKLQKESAVSEFENMIKNHRDYIFSNTMKIKENLAVNQNEQTKFQKIIDDCEARKTTYSEVPDYTALKNEINREFEKRGIHSEARFACEYVLGLTDEEWRDSIETFLGRKRYTIIVEPKYYDIADDVLNESQNKYAHLFNTKLLMKKEIKPEQDSAVHFLKIKNQTAQKYFDYQLGRIHAVTKDKVRNYENAISKEGRVSVAMDSFFLHTDKIRFYCLGQEAIELNRIKAVNELERLKREYKEYREQLDIQNEKKAYLEREMTYFTSYNYDACKEYDNAVLDCSKRKAELKSLQDAQKNNMEYIELAQRVDEIQKELSDICKERQDIINNKTQIEVERQKNKQAYEEMNTKIDDSQKRLNELQIANNIIFAKAVEEYDKLIAESKSSQGEILKNRDETEKEMSDIKCNLLSAQIAYNIQKKSDEQLPQGESTVADYQKRMSKIWMDDREVIINKLNEQTSRYEDIFKNEFVLTVLKSCESAKDDLKYINRELERLKFKSKYEFDVKYVKDGSDYEKILKYAKYLKEREELGGGFWQNTFDSVTLFSDDEGEKFEEDIKKIINRIADSNDKEQLERYADYRNYMTYEILLTNDVLTKAKLSKQSGYNSGAEVQIPYMLILLSALLMIYNDKNSSTRLVFIDEPFAKMDSVNVKIMLEFMAEQNLQMIFCAPDKTELIGNECEVILAVHRTMPNLMDIGIVHMRKGV